MRTPADTSDGFWIGDRYCGLFRIGIGGMGEVWAGKALGDRGFERPVAIKRLLTDRRTNEAHHRALLDEATILQHLASPNIVTVLDLREVDGLPHIIMEYIDGPELRDILKFLAEQNETVPLPIALHIANEVSKGLSLAHKSKHPETGKPLGLVHRDISPSNILISSQGAVKIADFGIAKSTLQTTQTQLGTIKGKYRYMSPEQAKGMEIDFRTDYFALGLTLYELICGKSAYSAQTDAGMIEAARNGQIEYTQQIDSNLRIVLDKLLAYNVADRYSDLEEFRNELGKIAIGTGGIASNDELSSYLADLGLEAHKNALERKKQIEDSHNLPMKVVNDETADTIATDTFKSRKRIVFLSVGLSIILTLIIIAVVLFKSTNATAPEPQPEVIKAMTEATAIAPVVKRGSLSVSTIPDGIRLIVEYNNRKTELPSPARLNDLPLNIPIAVTSKKSGYKTVTRNYTLTEQEAKIEDTIEMRLVPKIRVRFAATPPSQVSIPGRLPTKMHPPLL